jgi:hypothetical protein
MELLSLILAPSAVVLLIGAIRAVIVGRAERRSERSGSGILTGRMANSRANRT